MCRRTEWLAVAPCATGGTHRRGASSSIRPIGACRRSCPTTSHRYGQPRREFDEIERELFASERDLVVAYVGGTDGIMHLFGDDAGTEFLMELNERLVTTIRRHLRVRGRPLRIALFSDHGCGSCRVHRATGFDDLLRDEGLRVVERLKQPEDVVAPTFGLVNFGALFLRNTDRAGAAALAVTATMPSSWPPIHPSRVSSTSSHRSADRASLGAAHLAKSAMLTKTRAAIPCGSRRHMTGLSREGWSTTTATRPRTIGCGSPRSRTSRTPFAVWSRRSPATASESGGSRSFLSLGPSVASDANGSGNLVGSSRLAEGYAWWPRP